MTNNSNIIFYDPKLQELGKYIEKSNLLFVLHIFLKNEENEKIKRYLQLL